MQEEVNEIYKEMAEEVQKREEVINDQQKTNGELRNYIEKLEEINNLGGLQNKGKNISEVKKKSRTLNTFLSRASTALFFARSFVLEIEGLTVKESKTGIVHNIGSTKKKTEAKALTESEKTKGEQTLFLMDKFGVGDSFIHELSMANQGSLPRSYLVNQIRNALNKLCHVVRTPGEAEGAQISFYGALQEKLEDLLTSNPNFDYANENVKIKLSGDGARMTRNTSFIISSFAFLQGLDDVMSAKGNHSVGVVKGSESYHTLKESFKDIFKEINDLNDKKKITVKWKELKVELFLGGDYKFILNMLGLKGATSHYACSWCKVHKDDRHDMSFDLDHYNSAPLKRTLEELKEMAGNKKDNYCCEYPPLLKIDLDHVILDELHLLLRVTDVLANNLLQDVFDQDKEDDMGKKILNKRGFTYKI